MLPNPEDKVQYPAVVWVEYDSGNVAPVHVIRDGNSSTEYFWTRERKTDRRFRVVSDFYSVTPGMQSGANLRFINGATETEISDIIKRTKNNTA